jgi:hypothetical protein
MQVCGRLKQSRFSETIMSAALATGPRPAIPADVETFAAEKDVRRYLDAAIDLARRAFPASALHVSLDRDAEEEAHRYIALDVETADLTADELLAGQTVWSAGLGRVCPSRYAVYFVLGWR